jgi:hypothetical protein
MECVRGNAALGGETDELEFDSSFVYLVDLDFDSIPEAFEATISTSGEVMGDGYRFNGARYAKITLPANADFQTSEFLLFRTESGDLQWVSSLLLVDTGGLFTRRYDLVQLDGQELRDASELLVAEAAPERQTVTFRVNGKPVSLNGQNRQLLMDTYYTDTKNSFLQTYEETLLASLGERVPHESLVIRAFDSDGNPLQKSDWLQELREWKGK